MHYPCPLCHSDACELYHAEGERRWFRCPSCTLIHLDPALRLSPRDERARYSHHENNPHDPRYVDFLRRLADPLARRLLPGARGLDFGCGPSPVLAGMLNEAGFPCRAYDPFFFPDASRISGQYDFVACSEVVEHACDPTHVCFYAESTMRWIAGQQGWSVDFPRPDVTLFSVPRQL
jgi:hypothetical protein